YQNDAGAPPLLPPARRDLPSCSQWNTRCYPHPSLLPEPGVACWHRWHVCWRWSPSRRSWASWAVMSGVTLRKEEPMASLLVFEFDRPDGAERMLGTLQQLQTQQLIQIQDAAIVSWGEGKKKPKTRQLTNMTGALALGGTFWGMLFGLLFFIPLLGAAIG